MFLVVFAGACSELAGPTGIEEPQFAKAGNKGKPGGGGGDPVLQEFWVIPGSSVTDADVIHVVWSGGGTSVNPSVVWDYFFDGIRGDDAPVDEHYEFIYAGPPDTPGEELEDGMMHVDIPWDGRRRNEGGAPYPDYIATEVTGEGDPFAFVLNVYNGSTRLTRFIPFGVVVGGENTFGAVTPEATVEGQVHLEADVRSFATFQGEKPEGFLWVDGLTLDGSSLSCRTETTTTGRGKNKVRTTRAVLSGEVTVRFGRDPDITLDFGEYTWWEGHFLASDGALSKRVRAPSESGTFSVSGVMPEGWSGGTVEFIVDYLVSSSSTGPTAPIEHNMFANYVYDPSRNSVPTTAGLLGGGWSNDLPSASVDDGRFPVAHSAAFQVTCSGA